MKGKKFINGAMCKALWSLSNACLDFAARYACRPTEQPTFAEADALRCLMDSASLAVELRSQVQTCRVCGCTNDDCSQCVEKIGEPCSWVEIDLCSACVPAKKRRKRRNP